MVSQRKRDRSDALWERALRAIPVGTQTFGKAPKQWGFGTVPNFLQRAEGSHVWDVDGNEYIDYALALGPIILGYNYPRVNTAIVEQLAQGSIFSLNHPVEVELSELLIEVIPCAEMVRFGKNGSDGTSAAVRLARGWTNRDMILCSGYHGWQDWYIGSTSRNRGVPKAVRELTIQFPYNDLDAFKKLLDDHRDGVAAVIMEASNFEAPLPGYLEEVKELTHAHGAVLIFDEVLTGFRMGLGGAQEYFGVVPDLAVFAKAMANGMPVSALVGSAEIMELFSEVFYSFTFAGETLSLAAAVATISEMREKPVLQEVWARGGQLKKGCIELIAEFGLDGTVSCTGYDCWPRLSFSGRDGRDRRLRTVGYLLANRSSACNASHPGGGDSELRRLLECLPLAIARQQCRYHHHGARYLRLSAGGQQYGSDAISRARFGRGDATGDAHAGRLLFSPELLHRGHYDLGTQAIIRLGGQASVPVLRNARKVEIYRDPTRFTCQVGATQLSNGEVVLVFNEMRGLAHLDFDSIALIRSTDNGDTWDAATKRMVWECTHTFGSDTPSVMQLSDGTLLCNFLMTAFVGRKAILEDFGAQSDVLTSMRECDGVWLTRSADLGQTWEPAYKASVSPLRWGQPSDEPLQLPDGTLLMAVQGMMRARAYHSFEEPYRCFLIRSDNNGIDWEHWSTIAFDPAGIISFSEPALGRMPDGTLVAMMRTMHHPRRRHQRMWLASSRNDGESWSQPEATNLWGFPADLTLLQDGRMLCTYGYRREPYGVRACISDDGLHWDVANEFVIREGGTAPVSAEPNWYWHIGYPTTLQLEDGSMLTVDHQWTDQPPIVQFVVGVRWDLADVRP